MSDAPTAPPAAGPPPFTDAKGRAFALRRITVADLDELATLGLDVEAVSENIDLLGELAARRRKLAAVLWWFIGDAVVAAGVDVRDLHAALDGDALARAVEAIGAGVIDFFPLPPAEKARLIASLTAGGGGSAAPPSRPPASPDSTPAPTASAT